MKKNTILTINEFISYLISELKANHEINLNFAEDFLPDASDGSGWYGVKYPVRIFDEPYGLFSIGYYGGFATKTFEIEDDTLNGDTFENFIRFYFALHGIGTHVMVQEANETIKEA